MTTAETLDARDATRANALADVKNFILWCELWLLNVGCRTTRKFEEQQQFI